MTYKYLSVTEMISVEKAADESGLSYAQMMENAGRNLGSVVENACSHKTNNKLILGLIGKGNNGGDTLVALAYLMKKGRSAAAYIVGQRLKDDPLIKRVLELGGEVSYYDEDVNFDLLNKYIQDSEIILDGILGTGIRLPLRAPIPDILRGVKQSIDKLEHPPMIIAVDCPSGIDCDSGEAADDSIPANLTVCMAAVKHGLLKFPAYDFVGRLEMVNIGLPDNFPALDASKKFVIDQGYVQGNLPERKLNSHKGTFGKALIVGGSQSYAGAPLLAGRAAFRSGTGWVVMAVPESLQSMLVPAFSEATWLPMKELQGQISAAAHMLLKANMERVTAMLVGPGLGLGEETERFITELLEEARNYPKMVIDADGLKHLKSTTRWHEKLPDLCVLTPHPGEMSILAGLPVNEIQQGRLDVAIEYAARWRHIVVLKGAFTLVASPDGRTGILPFATPALARAGTGDVLAGIIAGLIAQGIAPFEAATTGVWVHAQAALIAAKDQGGTAGVLAGDLINRLPYVFGQLGW